MAALRELAVTKIATITGINAKTVATTELFVVPTGKSLIVRLVPIVRCTAFTVGSKAVQAVASFGGNSTTYNDFLTNTTFTIAASGVFVPIAMPTGALPVYAAGTSFRVNITTGSDASTETWAIDLFGYLF